MFLRSAIKKILERDDISTSRIVLCVSKVFPASSGQPIGQETTESNRKGQQQPESGKVCLFFWCRNVFKTVAVAARLVVTFATARTYQER